MARWFVTAAGLTLPERPLPRHPKARREVGRLAREACVNAGPDVEPANIDDDSSAGLDLNTLGVHLLGKELKAGSEASPLKLRESACSPARLVITRPGVVEPARV